MIMPVMLTKHLLNIHGNYFLTQNGNLSLPVKIFIVVYQLKVSSTVGEKIIMVNWVQVIHLIELVPLKLERIQVGYLQLQVILIPVPLKLTALSIVGEGIITDSWVQETIPEKHLHIRQVPILIGKKLISETILPAE